MKISTNVSYRIRINGYAWLSETGWSGYNKRFTMRTTGELKEGEDIYGIEQAKAHAKEYLSKEDEYTSSRAGEVLTLEKVTTIVEEVEILN
jgi:hypothetical protein